jgi:hypothetical protein
MVLSDRVQSVLREEGPNLPNNEISLRISSETIINFLQDAHPDAYTFFYFLSMMPAGALPNQLLQMWGKTHEKCSEILASFGLLDCSDQRRKLTAYMLNFAEQTIDKESSNFFNCKIAEHYEQMMR